MLVLLAFSSDASSSVWVCNMTDQRIHAAYTYLSGQGIWRTKGWYALEAGEKCRLAPVEVQRQVRKFYYYAKAADGTEWKDDNSGTLRCVAPTSPFDSAECGASDWRVKMREVIPSDPSWHRIDFEKPQMRSAPAPVQQLKLSVSAPEANVETAIALVIQARADDDRYVVGSATITARGPSADGKAQVIAGKYKYFSAVDRKSFVEEYFARVEGNGISCIRMNKGIFALSPCEPVPQDAQAAEKAKLIAKARVEQEKRNRVASLIASAQQSRNQAWHCRLYGGNDGKGCLKTEFELLLYTAIKHLEDALSQPQITPAELATVERLLGVYRLEDQNRDR